MNFGERGILQNAIASLQAGALTEAERGLAELLRQNPKHVAALNLYGIMLTQSARYDEAEPVIRRAIALDARSDATFYNYGIVLKALHRPQQAYEAFSKAIAINAAVPESWNNRGTVLNDLQRHDEAVADFQKAIALNPRYAEAYHNLAGSVALLGQHERALAAYDTALKLKPDFPDAVCNRGKTLLQLRRPEDALASFERAVVLRPDHADALYGCGLLRFGQKRYAEALAAFERALKLRPDLKFLPGRRMHAKMTICDWSDFDGDCARLVSEVRADRAAVMPFDFLAVPSSWPDQLTCARIYAREEASPPAAAIWRGERYSHDRIRIAYLSADFRDHPVSHLLAGLFEEHDRRQFETIAISFGADDGSEQRSRVEKAFERFVDVIGKTDLEIAQLMRDLEVDIAIDLMGHTSGSRPQILSHRPAPVQVNYLGFSGTTGADHIDYIVGDRFVTPQEARQHFSECVVEMPDTYFPCDGNRKISGDTPARAEQGLPETGVVFCAYNNSYKITPALFDVWMRLLRAVEGSVLWLSRSSAEAVENILREAGTRGVDAERLRFAPIVPAAADHLARLRLADIFLDTLPYNAHTTASDALLAGLPVVSCLGESFAGRVAASLLHAAGLPELVTTDLVDYEALALKLAREPGLLGAIKEKLARNRGRCALFDTARFARQIEAAYRTMWEIRQRGEAPRSFGVDPIANGRSGREQA